MSPGSPAQLAGLRGAFRSESEATQGSPLPKGGDVIVAADNQEVASIDQLATYLDAQKRVGDTVGLKLIRDGRELTLEPTLAEWPS